MSIWMVNVRKKIRTIVSVTLVVMVLMTQQNIVWAGTIEQPLVSDSNQGVLAYGDFIYSVNSDNETVTIVKYTGEDSKVVFPGNIDGKKVTKLGEWNSSVIKSDAVTSIEIPETVEDISDNFAYCVNLENIKVDSQNKYYDSRDNCNAVVYTKDNEIEIGCINTKIPDSIVSIGQYAFAYRNIKDIIIPSNIKKIYRYAFSHCTALNDIELESGLEVIQDYAFEYCENLTSLTIPNSVTEIQSEAFLSCKRLGTINISSSVNNISSNAFKHCSGISSINVDQENKVYDSRNNCNAIISSKNNVMILGCSNTIIPDDVKRIGDNAFDSCKEITNIEIPQNIRSIGECAFAYCENLEEIKIPDEVTSIGSGAFEGCGKLVYIKLPANLTEISNSCFSECGNLSEIKIPEKVSEIGGGAFKKCTELRTIILPNKISKISGSLFQECINLETIDIPSSVSEIESFAFYGCKNLHNIILPEKLKTIEEGAFGNCISIEKITIPSEVERIGTSAFGGCISLEDIKLYEGVKNIAGCAFSKCIKLRKIDLPPNVTNIGYSAFEGCSNLVSVNMQGKVENIDNYAFENCKNLTQINIPASIKKIGVYVFRNCSNDLVVRYEGNICDFETKCTEWGDIGTTNVTGNSEHEYEAEEVGVSGQKKFKCKQCSSNYILNYTESDSGIIITNVEVLSKTFIQCDLGKMNVGEIISIDKNAFLDCRTLYKIGIPNSVTSIGDSAFAGCNNLVEINIPEKISSIGNNAFYGCNKINSIVVDDSNNTYDSRDNCNALIETSSNRLILGCNNTIVPNDIVSIDGYAFYGCNGLRQLHIPASVSEINEHAVTNCSNLNELSVDANNCVYDSRNNCNAIINTSENELIIGSGKSKIPQDVESIGEYAFSGLDNLTSLEVPATVWRIGDGAFSKCHNLIEVKILGEMVNIGANVFSDCISLTEIKIPDNVKEIGKYAFKGCNSLEKIYIPNSVETIRYDAFRGCEKLNNIQIPASVKEIGSYAFGYGDSIGDKNTELIISCHADSAGKDYADNYGFKCIVEPHKVEHRTVKAATDTEDGISVECYECTICHKFYNDSECKELIQNQEDVVIPKLYEYRDNDDKQTITLTHYKGDSTEIVVPSEIDGKKVTALEGTFYTNTKIVSVKLPDTITYIGVWTFSDCSSLESVDISDSVIKIDELAFRYCEKLKSITIPKNVEEIGDSVLLGSGNLESICVVPENKNFNSDNGCNAIINTNTGNLIAGCNNTKIPNDVTSIGDYAFFNCDRIKSIDIPVSVMYIGRAAFGGCTSLKSITIPNSNTELGGYSIGYSMVGKFDQSLAKEFKIVCYEGSTAESYAKENGIEYSYIKKTQSISLNKTNLEMENGDTYQLKANVSPADVNRKVVWETSDSKVVDVDSNGKVTAVGKGTATITATVQDGSGISSRCDVTVINNIYNVKEIDKLETSHPYDIGCRDIWTYSVKGAKALNITFAEESEMADNIDSIIIYNKSGNKIDEYFGKDISGKSVMVPGNTVKIRLNSSSGKSAYGFKVINVEALEVGVTLIGDVNDDGEIDSVDAVLLKKYLAGYEGLEINLEACDTNGDGEISSSDSVMLLKYLSNNSIQLG